MYKLALVAVAVLAVRPARADVPVLEGHRFVPSSLTTWSFIDTEVSSTSEAGITDFVVRPDIPVLSSFVSVPAKVDGSYLMASQRISASVAFAGVFSLTGQLTAYGIVPRETTSSLALGAHSGLGESIGASLRLLRTDSLQVTLRADFQAQQIESVIPERIPSSPRVSGDLLGVRPALAAALAFLPSVGLQGSFFIDWEHYDVGTTDNVTSVAGALAATFSLQPVPLTLLLGGNVMHEFGRDVSTVTAQAVFGPDRTDWNIEAGLYLMCRRELDLGLIYQAEVAGGDHNNRQHGLFRLGYYF